VEKTVEMVLDGLSKRLQELEGQMAVLSKTGQSTDGHATEPAVPVMSSVPATAMSPHGASEPCSVTGKKRKSLFEPNKID
jgi:hypothetical protein